MFDKRIDKEEVEELKRRQELINSYKLVVQALEVQKMFFVKNVLAKHGWNPEENYNVDLKTGKLTKVKPPVNPPKKNKL